MTLPIYRHERLLSVSRADVKASKKNDLKTKCWYWLPHEGIVPSDTWLTCKEADEQHENPVCPESHPHMAGRKNQVRELVCSYEYLQSSGKQYLRCTKRLDNKSCPGCGKIITSELEAVVYQQMVKLASYKTLTGKKKAAKANPKITALQVELLHVDSEIEKLVDSLTGANNVLFSYVNVKIAELDGLQTGTSGKDSGVDCVHQPEPDFRLPRYLGECIF